MNMPYLRDMINNHKAPVRLRNPTHIIIEDDLFGEWKIQLTKQINFISSLGHGEIRTMDLKKDNVEILKGSERGDIIKELLNLFWKNIRKNWKKR